MLLALILSLSVGPVLVTAAVCERGFVRSGRDVEMFGESVAPLTQSGVTCR